MKDVKKLSLVLMKSLNLYIKDRTRIYIDTVVLLNVLGKTYLVLVLNIHEFLLSLLIISINLKLVNLRKVCNPVITNMSCYPVSKKRVTVKKESSLCNTISLVVELIREHLIEVFKFLIL